MRLLSSLCSAAFLLSIVLCSGPAAAKENELQDAKMAWWREAKFGMFVHWGIYSVTGGEYNGQKLPNSAEWMMCRGKIPIAEYEKYAAQFNPTKFDAKEFVARAKNAGMKYIVITAKHHDGFAMFDSKSNPFNVVDATPFGRDIMKELAIACRDAGLRFGFYYSQAQDWHHPGGHGNNWDKSLKRVSNDQYVREKAAPEVKQLLTEYGPISIFWWDTPRKMSPESFDSLHSLTNLQPAIVTNNRLGKDYPGDHKTFERHIPPAGPAGSDWEVCMPISGSWGYKKGDLKFKSSQKLIQNLVDITSKGGNYLLNVSPTGEGTILPQAEERLEAIGQWMKINSESIYGTTGSPFENLAWGRCTKKAYPKGTALYLHVFDWPTDGKLLVPGVKNNVLQCYQLADWQALETTSSEVGITISLPAEAPDENDSVIVLKIAGELDVQSTTPTLSADAALALTADKAFIHNNEGSTNAAVRTHAEISHIGLWTDEFAWLEWNLQVKEPGEYEVWIEYSSEADSNANLSLAGAELAIAAESTEGYQNYRRIKVGDIKLDKSQNNAALKIEPTPKAWQPVNLRRVDLVPKR